MTLQINDEYRTCPSAGPIVNYCLIFGVHYRDNIVGNRPTAGNDHMDMAMKARFVESWNRHFNGAEIPISFYLCLPSPSSSNFSV